MSKLEAVRAKIIEAVPEIVELKFGCRIEEARAQEVRYVGYSNRQHALNAVLEDGDNALLLVDDVFTSTIRGRDITLADVLRAIRQVEEYEIDGLIGTGPCVSVDAMGFFTNGRGTFIFDGGSWNLSLSLDQQGPEVIEFLGKVLGV